ncbi:PREDICTED: probable LRR receptor-like serine/threonine-protein kinase At3g47570 [Prunus mume]|uniref:Probable LRR receptor-like serine/threonine-protein kinase At3g47570 n=1 Tax=Prunus mume TaxID=102107 RepID=A0ABM1LHE3_PRUMU|nr:PREDICTED: probable LRR receptor-like serine/threonine-protein kinase At3g47570 [Prunus mume]
MVSTRGDMYKFGIVVIETFIRRKPTYEMFVGEMNSKQWIANSLLPDAMTDEVVDANLLEIGTEQEDDDQCVSPRWSTKSLDLLNVAGDSFNLQVWDAVTGLQIKVI